MLCIYMLQGVYANIVIVCLYCLYVCMFVCLFVCHWEASVEVNPRTCLERMLPIIQGTTRIIIKYPHGWSTIMYVINDMNKKNCYLFLYLYPTYLD